MPIGKLQYVFILFLTLLLHGFALFPSSVVCKARYWISAMINDNLCASRAQRQTQFELCRGAAVNADISQNLLTLDRSLRGARVRLAA